METSTGPGTPVWTLYFWPPASHLEAPPSSLEVKVRDLCFNMSNNTHFHLSQMDFFACTFECKQCNNAVVSSVNLVYPSYDRLIQESGPVDLEDGWTEPHTEEEAKLRFFEAMGAQAAKPSTPHTLIDVSDGVLCSLLSSMLVSSDHSLNAVQLPNHYSVVLKPAA